MVNKFRVLSETFCHCRLSVFLSQYMFLSYFRNLQLTVKSISYEKITLLFFFMNHRMICTNDVDGMWPADVAYVRLSGRMNTLLIICCFTAMPKRQCSTLPNQYMHFVHQKRCLHDWHDLSIHFLLLMIDMQRRFESSCTIWV